jgi:D-3-phosphoglycerate dehydrogenase
MVRVSLRYAGEVGELNTHLLRNAVLKGVLSRVVDEPANLVNAATLAAERGLTLEETQVRRTQGFPDTLGVTLHANGAAQFSVEGTVLHGAALRILAVDEIDVEAPLEGRLLFLRNRDVPGVIGRVGTLLGSREINIATFAYVCAGAAGAAGLGGQPRPGRRR